MWEGIGLALFKMSFQYWSGANKRNLENLYQNGWPLRANLGAFEWEAKHYSCAE